MKHYGSVHREDRIGEPAMCDKAWHLGHEHGPAPASKVLTCAHCGRRYARCADCDSGVTSCAASMRAHVTTCALARRRRERGIDGLDR